MDEQDEALRARAEARIGTTLGGKYRLDRVLGIGGMATVFAATHRNQAELAVKLLHPELSLRDDLKKRFLREGYVGNSVKHSGAVLVVDDDVADDGAAFLVMELLRGRTLEDVWERAGRKMSVVAVTAIVTQVLDVLAAAHEKAIVHRDLKPANLFITTDGTIKVLDFGIARLRDAVGGSQHATRTGTLMGTPAFMAPEQAQAIAADIDAQTDLWAIGATMFTLLSGQLVHDGDNSSQLLIKAGTAKARPISAVVPDVDPAFAAVVDRALAFHKADRWPSAVAMHDALIAAAVASSGKPPSRDVLATMFDLDPYIRRFDSTTTERAPGAGSNTGGPRLVVKGEGSSIRGNDPTFATPSGPPPRGSSAPGSGAASSVPPLPGLSTANPVSAEFSIGRRKRSPVVWGGAAAALLLCGGTCLLVFDRSSTTPDVKPATSASSVAASSPPPPPSAVTPAEPANTASPPATASAPPAAVDSAPPVVSPPTHPATAVKANKGASTLPPPKPTPSAAQAPDCTTPYTLDGNGDKHWKPECVAH
jgi:eukaryotic-like serine/threonine-protein kinase